MQLNDELLCAYLDDELDAATRARVTQALESDAGGRVRLERMRVADERLRREVPPASSAPRDPIADFIREHESGAAAPTRRRWIVPASLAAAVAVLVLGFFIQRLQDPADARYADGTLATALETQASGEAPNGDSRAVRVLLTVRTAERDVCRLFESSEADGVACRQSGRWRIVAWDATSTRRGEFQPAGGNAALDAVLDRLGGATLDAPAEAAMLRNHWAVD